MMNFILVSTYAHPLRPALAPRANPTCRPGLFAKRASINEYHDISAELESA